MEGRPPGPEDPSHEHGTGVEIALCDVYVIRKKLYISEEHERALKARELGVSEATLVRRMPDSLLHGEEGGRGLAGAGVVGALEGYLEEADQLAESHRLPEGYLFNRDELYEDRT